MCILWGQTLRPISPSSFIWNYILLQYVIPVPLK
jgi:hypothetical protein